MTAISFAIESIRQMIYKVLTALGFTGSAIFGILNNQKRSDSVSYYSKSGKKRKKSINIFPQHKLLMYIYVFLSVKMRIVTYKPQLIISTEKKLSIQGYLLKKFSPNPPTDNNGEESGHHWSWCQWLGLHTVLSRRGAGAHLL